MNQEQFEHACAEAISKFHDPVLDGPLLVSTRMNVTRFEPASSGWLVYPEYAAAIGMWPTPRAHPYGGLSDHGPVYYESVRDALNTLAAEAKGQWSIRLNEAGGDFDTEPEPETSCEFEARDKGK